MCEPTGDGERGERGARGGGARVVLAVLAVQALIVGAVWAQYSVRPDDPVGLSIREPRVRVIHSETAEVPGTSMHLQQWDPWLAYRRGRTYFLREWTPDDGLFRHIRPQFTEAASTNSCGMCHNLPFPSAGSGGNVAVSVGAGRNTPHFFGGGLLETAGLQVRAELLDRFDVNGNGYFDVPDETAGKRAVIEAAPGVEIDFGSLEDLDGDGRPDLNPAVMVRMVDAEGRRPLLSEEGRGLRLDSPGVQGFDLAVGVFASSAGDHQFPSMRMFAAGVYHIIMGIVPEGEIETFTAGPHRGYLVGPWGTWSNAGAFQSEVMLTENPLDEPDQSRRASISSGELDLLEWYMLNHPSPALGAQDAVTRRGRKLLGEMGCTSCHVPEWRIRPHDEERGFPGDRRFFDLAVEWVPERGRLEGDLSLLTEEVEGPDGQTLHVPRRDGVTISDVYTDLRHHDLGPRFWEYSMRGDKVFVRKEFRTAPLWGVGSSAPYGHDGQSISLDQVIRRHGGAAEESTEAYRSAAAEDREAVLAFLRSLVLYRPETLPTDLDGDGRLTADFRRGDVELGPEIFRPELMFQVPPRYRGWVGTEGEGRYFSYELQNVTESYGLELEALRDADGSGVPDLLERGDAAAPATGPDPVSGRAGR